MYVLGCVVCVDAVCSLRNSPMMNERTKSRNEK